MCVRPRRTPSTPRPPSRTAFGCEPAIARGRCARAGRLAEVALAPAHVDADRAGPAVPAGPGQRARVDAAAGRRPTRAGVQQYFTSHPAIAPLLNHLGLFNVFAAPWFAAIYLLLFASLVGCVVPRTFRLAGSARTLPPRAPRNLARLPRSAEYATALAPARRGRGGGPGPGRPVGFRLRRATDGDPGSAGPELRPAPGPRVSPRAAGSPRRRDTCGKSATCSSTWRCSGCW